MRQLRRADELEEVHLDDGGGDSGSGAADRGGDRGHHPGTGEDPQESTGAPTVTTGQKTPSSQTSTPPTTEKPTETTKPSETTQPPTTQPSEPPTQPTEPPTQPTEPVEPIAWQEYNQTPDTFMVIQYYPGREYDYSGEPFDTSQMKYGGLYAVDNGTVYEIAGVYTSYYFVTKEHIYFVDTYKTGEIHRCDHRGNGKITIYTSESGKISDIQYFGTNAQGKIIFLEDSVRIKIFDIASNEAEVLLEASYISGFTYVPYTIEDEQIMGQFGTEFIDSAIYWRGWLNDADSYLGSQKDYCYFVETDTHWFAETWEQEFRDPHVNGEAFTYQGYDPTWKDIADLSKCVTDHLYYIDEETYLVHPICEEPVRTYARTETCVYFVKESEPEKLYAAYLFDLSAHHLVYEAASGPITNLSECGGQYADTAITMLENEQRIIRFDLATKIATVLMEQYHIEYYEVSSRGYFYEGTYYLDGSWRIYFYGKPTEDGKKGEYMYYCDTGELKETEML